MRLKGSLELLPDLFKIILVFTFFLTMMLISAGLGALICSWVYGINFFSIAGVNSDYTNPGTLAAAKLFQMITATGTFVITPLIAAVFIFRNPCQMLGLSRKPLLLAVIPTLLLMFSATPFINYLVKVNSFMALPEGLKAVEHWMRTTEKHASEITEAFLQVHTTGELLLNILVMALIPAIGEELMFRGVIQTILKRMFGSIHIAIFFTSLFFSAMHMQFFGFLPRIALGMVLGFLFEWSGSLWLPVIAHFVNNATAVILYYIAVQHKLPFNQDTVGAEKGDLPLLIASAVVTWFFLFIIKKQCEPAINKLPDKQGDAD